MTLAETVKDIIDAEHKSGLKQREIAERHNVSRSYIQSLLTGRCPYEGITLDSLHRMFPRATLDLSGNGGITQVASNVRVNTQSINIGKTAEAFKQEAIMAMLELDLPADTLKLVLNTLKGISS
jgi:transcriptional regulator with XRE-family HTH domain